MIRIIIDAYNLIFQCGLQPKTLNSPLALHRTRMRLISELTDRIGEAQRRNVQLVFDAKNPPGETTPALEGRGFKIAFARDYEDADAMVIELIRRHSHPKKLTVVSSDHRIQTAALRRGATAIDSDVWFDRAGKPSKTAHSISVDLKKTDVSLSEKETRRLIDEFSDLELESPKTQSKPSASDVDELDVGNPFNPFPPGYGEDLLDN